MSLPVLSPDPAVLGDIAPFGDDSLNVSAPSTTETSTDVGSHLVRGASTLGASVLVERGTGFLANILAARFGGASVFGAYSLGISTANNISTYAAGGIGATATRFSGKYTYDSAEYAVFARVLATVAIVSAGVAAAALWAGAAPIASWLHKPNLIYLLRWASLSAAGMILLESARGFFVGQRRHAALGVLSISVGAGMVILLPAMAALHHPTAMIVAQGAITSGAVGICLLLARPLRLLTGSLGASSIAFGTMLREVWAFGFIQLSGLLSANLAGWWLTALIARSDTTLIQMGFFAVSSQLRNLTGIVPALLTESSYAVMAGEETLDNVPDRVMALCTFAAISVSFSAAGLSMIVLPWALRLLYGRNFSDATVAAAIGMGVAVIQMGNAPASARMSVVSVRWVALGNTAWAIFVAVIGTWMLLHHGTAATAMFVFFAAHVLLALLVFVVLHRERHLPKGTFALFVSSTAGVCLLGAASWLRATYPHSQLILTAVMIGVFVSCFGVMLQLGRRHGWLIALERFIDMARDAVSRLKIHTTRWREQ